ncbi:MAG: TRAP transporter small permease [Paracoccus sp. (in: a-proteobacteria)]|nr:TRAP transporter small permease [Paracoccus sp. (in: a-proteobacteria)]
MAAIESFVLAAGVLLMATNTVANVVGRHVFSSSLYFSEELNRILIIVITFAGISYAARQGRHIRMSALYDAAPHGLRKAMMILIAVLTALFMFGLAYFAWQYMMTLRARGAVLPALRWPEWWILLWVPVGLTVTGIQYTMTAIRNVIEADIYLSTGVKDGYDHGSNQGREG